MTANRRRARPPALAATGLALPRRSSMDTVRAAPARPAGLNLKGYSQARIGLTTRAAVFTADDYPAHAHSGSRQRAPQRGSHRLTVDH